MAGTLQQDNLVEASVWQENDAGQDFQLMEQHKVTAHAFRISVVFSQMTVSTLLNVKEGL